jgi:hypothetical protein
MMSIALLWTEIKSYQESVGPEIGRPPRPTECPICKHGHIWYDGWRLIFCTTLVSGISFRFENGLLLQRVACARCWFSWTLWPPFIYPHRSYEPDLVEAACLAYLKDAEATYVRTAKRFGCSWTMLWKWIGWLAQLIPPAELVAEAARLDSSLPTAELISYCVPQNHEKARSAKRERNLLQALQVLVAIVMLARAQAEPPADPSPLRWFLTGQFRVSRRKALISGVGWSPAFDIAHRGPPG